MSYEEFSWVFSSFIHLVNRLWVVAKRQHHRNVASKMHQQQLAWLLHAFTARPLSLQPITDKLSHTLPVIGH